MTRWPAEWEPHSALWIGYPGDPAEWPVALSQARVEVAALAELMAAGERTVLVCRIHADAADASARVTGAVEVVVRPFGDVWLRDTGPLVVEADGRRVARRFAFNGWGGKYVMSGDESVGALLAADLGLPVATDALVLEGGAIDTDGAGLAVTTEQCLLNPNRNPGWSRDAIEGRLRERLGIERLLWLGEGLANDHTDGHVDNLARFVAPGVLALPVAAQDDPNAAVYADARARAAEWPVRVVDIPSPGRVERNGEVQPASHMNFLIGDATVAVPTYGTGTDEAAVAALAALFPDREVVGVRADGLLSGGGSLHCASMQVVG